MSLVAFKARNHPQQAVRDAVDDRGTRPDFFDPLNATHRFTLDAAASVKNHLCERYSHAIRMGCSDHGQTNACGATRPILGSRDGSRRLGVKCGGGCELVVMLLPANRCEQKWWQTWVEPFRDREPTNGISLRTRFLSGRMRFVMPKGFQYYTTKAKGDRPPFGCVLLTWEAA